MLGRQMWWWLSVLIAQTPFVAGFQAPRSPFSVIKHRALTTTVHRATRVSTGERMINQSAFSAWALENGIQVGGIKIDSLGPSSGLGLVSTQTIPANKVLINVPSSMSLSVQTPKDYNRKASDLCSSRDIYNSLPWYGQLSLQLNALDQNILTMGGGGDQKTAKPWMDVLPRKFSTPIHFTDEELEELQYPFLVTAVNKQKKQWLESYATLSSNLNNKMALSYEDFQWGCECARSRAFSGSFSGSAFNVKPYAFTLLLITAYVGLGLGSLDQAANGAAIVVCGNILKDFVFPKLLFKDTQTYVICPYIDMANHVGLGASGNVAFEYFSDGYSLASNQAGVAAEEVYISYGSRSNDQLLQYYGFVEENNPFDVYLLPPIREWDIEALETAIGRTVSSGRLLKLERAGLLGNTDNSDTEVFREDASNKGGGVVVSRQDGVDPAVMQALRALISTDEEWEGAGEAIGNFSVEYSGGEENERLTRLAARTAIELELASKATSLEDDENLIEMKFVEQNENEQLALRFRIEKKRLLRDTISRLQ
mmetsp:Transcript_45504/g.53281  ORF Transcript_45504/g.53281 Transcript_45504/m.53281 type:complete len:539 (+) Transcript_45504:125-1741(+)